MSTDGSRPRLSALPDWSAVPGNSEEDRTFLNRRLALFGKLMFLLAGGFLVFENSLTVIMIPERRLLATLMDRSTVLHAVAAGLSLAQWLLCRSGRRSPRELNAIDAVGILGIMVAYSAMILPARGDSFEPCLVLALITGAYVVPRSIIVPGTTRRTFGISTVACLPSVVATYLFVSTAGGTPSPVRTVLATAYVGLWSIVTISIATVAARVIYGLQQKVLEAAQLGQYTLEEKIGEGGMGSVWRARHAMLRRPTAVKLLPRDRAGAHEIERFEREVQLTSALSHPNTIAIYDYGHTPDGVFYYAMEYLDGITLQDLVDDDGPLPPARVVHLLRQIAASLGEAHDVGLIHRDVKPANVMLCVRGGIHDHVKVVDFGLVKDLDRTRSASLSTHDMLVGTPLYLAPEAIVSPGHVDVRTDLYALGAVAYFLLAGTPPFEGASFLEVCAKHLHSVPERPSERSGATEVPRSLEDIVMSCLAKDQGERPASATELLRELEACTDVGTWTAADARAWWEERAPKLREAAERRRRARNAAAESTVQVTVAIDFQRRDPLAMAARV